MLAFKINAVPYERDGDRILLKIMRGSPSAELTLDANTLLTANARSALRGKLETAAAEAREGGLSNVRLCLQPASAKAPKGWATFQKDVWFIDI
jgi:hypothetical protein